MIQKFRKKPVEIEAEQFVVWNNKEIPAFIKLHDVTFPVYNVSFPIIRPFKNRIKLVLGVKRRIMF